MTYSCVMGVDGGISGAIALLTDTAVRVYDVPTTTRKTDGKKVFDPDAYMELLRDWRSQVGAFPGFFERGGEIPFVGADGRRRHQSSMYPYGFCNGAMFGIAKGLMLPSCEVVEPQVWKRFFHLLGKSKEASREKASELYPAFCYQWKNKTQHNRAEAVLIAHYGMHR